MIHQKPKKLVPNISEIRLKTALQNENNHKTEIPFPEYICNETFQIKEARIAR